MENEVHDFPLRGVKVTLPSEHAIRSYFPPKRVGIGAQGPAVFTPIRVMFDFEILEEDRETIARHVNFTLRVYFTKAEFEVAKKDKKQLKLGYWDKVNEQWVVIAVNNEQFIDGTPGEEDFIHHGYIGYIEAQRDEWSDPPIALGS